MKKFDRTRLWTLIFDPVALGSLTQSDANAVLNDFAEELHDYCRRETKIAERTRTLNYARSDLRIQLESFRSGAGKNVATLKLLKQAISLIDCEIGLVEAELQYPDRFIVFPADHAPLARWGGNVVDLIEYFIGPQAAEIIQHPSGKPMNFE